MQYIFTVSDFDGTLLRRDDRISPRTVEAIAAYVKAGGIFGISTGRAYTSIVQRLGELGIEGSFPVMSCQGALSRDSKSGETLAAIPMPQTSVVEFLRRAEELGFPSQFYTAESIYAPYLNETNEEYFRMNRLMPVIVDKVSEYAAKIDEPILKALVVIPPEERARVTAAMQGIAGVKVFASHALLIEAVSEQAGKGNGLRLACKRLGIDVSRSAAVGDELNDIEMIRAAGLGVAMGNAVPEVKAAADYITEDCNNDGVAVLLEKIIADGV